MYKIRLNKWGLQKYLRHQTPESFRHGRRALGRQTDQFLDRAVPSQQKRGNVVSVRTGRTAVVAPRPMSPRLLATPDPWQLPEKCIFVSHNFLDGTLDGGHWTPPENREHVVTWISQVAIGSNVLSRKMTAMGFSMLDVCFANFRTRLTSTEPHLLSDILVALAQFARSSDALVDAFLNYAVGLCNILYPLGNPVRIFVSSLHRKGWLKVKPHVHNILAAYWDTARRYSDPNDPYLDLQQCYTTFIGTVGRWISADHAANTFYAVLQRRKAMGLEDPTVEQMIYRHLILILPHLKREDEARMIAMKIIEAGPLYAAAMTNAYATLSILAQRDNDLDQALIWSRKNLQFSLQTWGVSNHRSAQALIELAQVLRSMNRLEEAKELVQLLGLTWEEFGYEVDNMFPSGHKTQRVGSRPSMLHIKGFRSRFRQAFDEMTEGEIGTYANSPPPPATPDLSYIGPENDPEFDSNIASSPSFAASRVEEVTQE